MNESTNGKPQPPDDNWIPGCWHENRIKFLPENLLPYAGKHIAWSWDGTHIVASADDEGELWEQVKAMGMNPSRVVYDYVDSIDEFCRETGLLEFTDAHNDEELLQQTDPEILEWLLTR